ncbi:MAG TPA: hypothetical protein VMG33_05740 [Steroidobacteraceae bacterium]|nr:hypothetical protein [Steroidobacteraceae bacterium]
MNTFTSTLVRDVTCAAAATVITLLLGMSFVSATAAPYGAHAQGTPMVLQQGWFGQPEPAVLVD